MQDRYFYPKIQAFTRVSALKQLVFMTVLHSLEALSQWQHKSGWHHKRGGFVPTMGALHEGHLALIRQAKASSDLVVVSILVNPTQFNDSTDFQAYPRTLETDAALAERAGADAVFAPTPEDLYGGTPSAQPVDWGSLTHSFEGEHRPGHFDGVVAVVDLLFSSVRPKLAVFGEKDLQQVAVVRRLAQERHPDVEVCVGSLVRDENGLALSSRNARLSAGKKAVALDTGALRPLFALVDLYATDGEYETAIQLLKDGIESGGKVQNDNTHIGSGSTWNKAHIDVIYAKMGEVHTRYEDYGDALECYHTAMSLNPHNGLAQKGVENLEKMMNGIDPDEDGEMGDDDEMNDDDGEY